MAVTLWLLVAISSGFYSQGNVTVLSAYETHSECNQQMKFNSAAVGVGTVRFACIRVKGDK